MATHSSILAWRIPWPEEPGRLRLMGLQRVGHDWVTKQACSNYENFHVELSHPRAGKGTECGGWDSFQSALQEHKQDLICLRNKDLWHYLCSMSWSCSYRQNCKITCTCTSCTWSHWSFTASCKAVVLITVWEGRKAQLGGGFQYFGHLMWRADSLEKTMMLGKVEDRRRRGWQRMK